MQHYAIEIEPRQEFAGDMLSVGRAAAVAGDQKRVAVTEGVCDGVGDRVDRAPKP